MSERNTRILVAEDSPLLRTILVDTLSRYGYCVETAENGQEAIDKFIENPPDLMIMDADMPVLDGVSACARIRELPVARYVRIIIVTGHDEQDWVDRAYAAGATDYIMKPINWDVLRNRIHYILQAKTAEEALFDEKEKAQVTLESIADGVITTDAQQRVEYLNPVASLLTGWANHEAVGQPLEKVFQIVEENTKQQIPIPAPSALPEDRRLHHSEQLILCHRDEQQEFAIEESAAPIRDRSGKTIGMVLVFHDVTENRQLSREISYQAAHDPLTHLVNRREFKRRLNELQDKLLHESDVEHCLLYLDLDRFKIVNDTCGHEAGDTLLRQVASALQQQIREQDTLARLGGDEFGVLLEKCPQHVSRDIAERLRQVIEDFRFTWQKHVFNIGISIGLVDITREHYGALNLLSMADSACYQAKDAGRNCIYVYQREPQDQREDIQWLSRLDDSFHHDRFALYFQPIMALEQQLSDHFQHCEILVRMENEGQIILPGAFFSTADRYNLLPDLDRWVVRNTLRWLKQHAELCTQIQRFSINLSVRSLGNLDFVHFIDQELQHNHISPQRICFELNEVDVLNHIVDAGAFVSRLHQLGCQFALDDFGSGLSAFSFLKNLPIDFLKIHGSFVNTMDNQLESALISAIHQIGQVMGLKTIAESLETSHSLIHLRNLGIHFGQGYLFQEPLPLHELNNGQLKSPLTDAVNAAH